MSSKSAPEAGLRCSSFSSHWGVRFYTCTDPTDPCPPKTALDTLVDDDATAIEGPLKAAAENKEIPGWRSTVRAEGTRLAASIKGPAERRLLISRQIARHEYRAWALLMVARTYLEPVEPGDSEDERRHARLFFASEALSDLDQALARTDEVTRDRDNGDQCATKVYSWMTGQSADLPRTRYLRAVALAAVAQAGGKVTKDEASREVDRLKLEFPAYVDTYPIRTNPFLVWATQPGPQ